MDILVPVMEFEVYEMYYRDHKHLKSYATCALKLPYSEILPGHGKRVVYDVPCLPLAPPAVCKSLPLVA